MNLDDLTKIADRVSVTWHQAPTPPFADAEFYDHGIIATVTGERMTVEIVVEGEPAYLHDDGRHIRRVDQFRAQFADGTLPVDGEDGWDINNGWFDLYSTDVDDGEGGHLDAVTFSLVDALAEAVGFAAGDQTPA